MFKHYVDFKIEDSQHSYFINRLFTRVHGFMADGKYNFAIDFPNYEDSKGLGNKIRIFSDFSVLDKLMNDGRIDMFIKNKVISTQNINLVPETDRYIILKRDRSIEKQKEKNKNIYFINYKNHKNDKNFMLFLNRKSVISKSNSFEFTMFGTSKNETTIPYF